MSLVKKKKLLKVIDKEDNSDFAKFVRLKFSQDRTDVYKAYINKNTDYELLRIHSILEYDRYGSYFAEKLCKHFILKGDENMVVYLVGLFEKYNSKGIALLFLNCGHEYLKNIAELWAIQNGYVIKYLNSDFYQAKWGNGLNGTTYY